MVKDRSYDTVAFDVRDNATMLFFANTSDDGDIRDYVLIMRTIEDNFDESLTIEIDERQFGGHDLLDQVTLLDNTLTLKLHEPADQLGGASEFVIVFEPTENNLANMERGAFRVFGDTLGGGTA